MPGPKLTDGAYLHRLREARSTFEPTITTTTLAQLTGIPRDKLHEIDVRRNEPYLSETVRIAQVLGTPGIVPLMTDQPLDTMDLGVTLPGDLSMLRAGLDVPLTLACRITLALGLSDPMQLHQRELDAELWTVTLERSAGICPICRAQLVGVAGHRPTCLADALWGPRDVPRTEAGGPPLAKRPGKGRRSSGIGHGLKAAREARGWKQQELANRVGIGFQYLSKLENGRLPLTVDKAKVIAAVLNVEVEMLFVNPNAGESV